MFRDPLMAQIARAGGIDDFDAMLAKTIHGGVEGWLGLFVSKAYRCGHMAVQIKDTVFPHVLDVFSNDQIPLLDPSSIAYIEDALRKESKNSDLRLAAKGDFFALPSAHAVEVSLALEVKRLSCAEPFLKIQPVEIQEPLNSAQREAVKGGFEASFCLLTGGPGTGKTYTAGVFLRSLLRSSSVLPLRVALIAPTGRAVQTLETSIRKAVGEGVLLEAKTIHSLVMSPKASFLPYHLVIIDECSMIDSTLMLKLFRRLHEGTKVLMLGDPDQLPSIEPGQPFFDLVEASYDSKTIRHFSLQECQRTRSEDLLKLASCVRRGDVQGAFDCLEDRTAKAVRFIECSTDEEWQKAEKLIAEEVVDPWKKGMSLDEAQQQLRKVALLTPCRKGYWGTDGVHSRALKKERSFVPVMSTKNSYQVHVMNGDLGVLERSIPFDLVHFHHCTVPSVLLPRCEKAFAMTVHKSQGGEFGTVVLVIPQGALLDRRLLYTAVTRAKERLVVIGQKEDLIRAISRKEERVSTLQQLVKLR